MEITSCEAESQLKFKGLMLGVCTLLEFKNKQDIPVISFLQRWINNSWEFLKQDKKTQEQLGIWLSADTSNCN